MPTYVLKNEKSGEIKESFMSISAMIELTEQGDWKTIPQATNLITHSGNIINKTSGDWKNHLENIKKNAGRNNTINT